MRMLQTLFPFCTYICRVYHWHPAPYVQNGKSAHFCSSMRMCQ
ncbi:hypothetical protein TVAGG3_0403940, partial [Trichomonas vaginalis G3]